MVINAHKINKTIPSNAIVDSGSANTLNPTTFRGTTFGGYGAAPGKPNCPSELYPLEYSVPFA